MAMRGWIVTVAEGGEFTILDAASLSFNWSAPLRLFPSQNPLDSSETIHSSGYKVISQTLLAI